ncbi:uncharacterized protein ccdc142 isoform 2-T3 [Menidia menidia]
MDHAGPESYKDPGGGPAMTADWENSESLCPDKEQRSNSCMVTDDLSQNCNWSQCSISRSLQRAESLLRSTFNPSLRWLFQDHSQDEEEKNFVVAHNLVSRSSVRLQRLQQFLLAVASQWQLVGGPPMGSPQVCFKGLPPEGGVVLHSPSIQGQYRALKRLLEQRSLLLFVHEYGRRVRLAAAHVCRVNNLLEQLLTTAAPPQNQTPSSCSSLSVGLSSLSQELRVHLNHWCRLSAKVYSDPTLRQALVHQGRLLEDMKQTLDLLGLQLLVLMEQYVFAVLSAVGRTQSDSVPREVLEDILTGTELYNQVVEEHRGQHAASQLRIAVLQQAHYPTVFTSLPTAPRYHPSVFSVKDLMTVFTMHQAEMVAKQLHNWTCEHSPRIIKVPTSPKARPAGCCCWASMLRPEWTWDQLQHGYLTPAPDPFGSQPTLRFSPPVHVSDRHSDTVSSENQQSTLAAPSFIQQRAKRPGKKGRTRTPQPHLAQSRVETLDSVQTNAQRKILFGNDEILQTPHPPDAPFHGPAALPQLNNSSVELLFQVLVSSSDLLAPLVPHRATVDEPAERLLLTTVPDTARADSAPGQNTAHPSGWNKETTKGSQKCQNSAGASLYRAERDLTTRPTVTSSSGFPGDGDPEKEDRVGAQETLTEPGDVHWPHSVQWLDLGQSLLLADLRGEYNNLLWNLCSKAFSLKLHVPQAGSHSESINVQGNHGAFRVLHRITQALETGRLPVECKTMLENFSLHLLAVWAHAVWDCVACRSLGSALRDKCLRNDVTCFTASSVTSDTMENMLLLLPPLMSSLCRLQPNSPASGSFGLLPSRSALQRQTVSLLLASVQLSTVWVMTKAYQFLSSWSLNKFLLVTQGDMKMLMESLDTVKQQTGSVVVPVDADHHPTALRHNQHLLKQQLEALDGALSRLKTFSSLVLRTFSTDCKRMSGEIFERTMPSAVHWRPNHRTGFPSCPSAYASQAAESVIGQVLEGVEPLPDDARDQALSITMTAFMEAWMEHILKQKIKFSVQGALQLKQDFDSIRELIQSDRYGLSAELHQRLLSLRVFQQVDSAVTCLLQQPQAKPYQQCTAWEPFRHCCEYHNSPADRGRDSIDTPVATNITNLGCVECEEPQQSDPSVVTSDLHAVDPSTSAEPYLAPSLALGPVQQEWLDLRIQSGARRWRLPSLQCLSKAEP